MRVVALWGSVTLLAMPVPLAGQSDGAVVTAVETITADDVRHHIGVLAHDSMRGRDTPSPEIEQVARYVGAAFRRFGLTPGGDEASFVQRYPIELWANDLAVPAVVVAGGPTWHLGREAARLFGGEADGASGPVVAVWGAVGAPADVAELPLAGAVAFVVTTLNEQGQLTPEAGRLLGAVYQRRPAAVLAVTNRRDEPWQQRLATLGEPAPVWPGGRRTPSGPPVLEVRDETARAVLAQRGFDLAAARASAGQPVEARTLEGPSVTVTTRRVKVADVTAPNTVGILEGSDPALKHEYIVFSAHMDHVGVGTPVDGDSIYNGADDDASGTAAVIELAEAFSRLTPRPKRSLIFLTVSGEEKGLWGSRHFAEHPPVPVEQLVANLNTDMIGRNWDDTVVVIGREHSDLGVTLARVNAAHPELNMTAVDDLWPEERFYFRSDHYNFARRGVPILFFFTGTHEDYHRPSDHVEKIDAEKESRIIKLAFYLGIEVANAAERPKWDPESYRRIVEGNGR